MSPIEGVSDIRRLPRRGKIRLGIKEEGARGSYPKAVEYFVCPEEVKASHGDKPKELPIMFPHDSWEMVAPQWYKCYSYTQGLICKGDGKSCERKVDIKTGDFASKETKRWEWAKGDCNPKDCPMIADKQCRKVMSLLFILFEVPGLGVYQLDTTSFYSITNINNMIAPDGYLRQYTKGKIAFIPLTLYIGPQVVTPMGEGRKTIQALHLDAKVKLADIIKIARQGPRQVLLPTLKEEEPPDDLFPDEVLEQAEVAGPVPGKPAPGKLARHPVEPAPGGTNQAPSEPPPPAPGGTQQGGEGAALKGSETDDATSWAALAADVKQGGVGKEGEATIATPKTQKSRSAAGRQPARAKQGEPGTPAPTQGAPSTTSGTNSQDLPIDLDWLRETLEKIHWTEDTAKSWIKSNFPEVDISGTLIEVLHRLNRNQAEKFTNELQDRAARVQPSLFS